MTKSRPRILFLYTEIANYFLSCVRELHKEADIAIIRWAVNAEAPFSFDFDPEWQVFERNQFVSKELITFSEEFKPDVIVCSGWVDVGYNSVAKHWKGKIPTILSLDNHYTGSIRQRIGRLISKYKIHSRFSHAWVPGKPQEIFARKLGFEDSKIMTGFYSADVDHFNKLYKQTIGHKKKDYPRRFLYMGRYVDFKGVEELWKAFELVNKERSDLMKWELWCVGAGELWEKRKELEGIKHFGFLQAREMEEIVKNTGVLILPSRKEPWGVVIHEMAVAGFPIISSDKVGASTQFLKTGENGLYFKSENVDSLREAMEKMMNQSDASLIAM